MWECVAALISAEQGFETKRFREFESDARASLRRLGLRENEIDEDNLHYEEILNRGINLLKNNRQEMLRLIEEGMRERIAKN